MGFTAYGTMAPSFSQRLALVHHRPENREHACAVLPRCWRRALHDLRDAILLPLPEMVRGGEVEAYDERGQVCRWKGIIMTRDVVHNRSGGIVGYNEARLLDLLAALPDLVIDFEGHVPGDHALRLAERAGIIVPKEAWDAVNKRAGLPQKAQP
jgi:hypothetical protein